MRGFADPTTDRVRLGPAPRGIRIGPPRLRSQSLGGICAGPTADSNSALCMLGKSGDSDACVEGCFGDRRLGIGQHCGGLRAGVFENLA